MAGVSAAISSPGPSAARRMSFFSTADIRTILQTAQRARKGFTEPGS